MKTITKPYYILTINLLILSTIYSYSQPANNKVIITGVRFSYPWVQKWIESYKVQNPNADIQIESRTVTDPAKYDILIEAYEPDAAVKDSREYVYIARYALLPFANSNSAFAKEYSEKGLSAEIIKQVYFNDIYADKKDKIVDVPFTVYTRLQKAGAPITFAKYFGFEQANIKGKAISGADEHLVKALLKDSTGVSYTIPGLLYNLQTRKQLDGLTVLPVDIDGNKKVNSEEKSFYTSLDDVIQKIEATDNLKNIPTEYIHVSIGKNNTNIEAIKFMQWILDNSQENLHQFGFLKPDPERFQQGKEKFEQLALTRK